MKHLSEKQISCYVDGALQEKEQRKIEDHFQSCPGCLQKIIGAQKISFTLQNFPQVSPQPGMLETIHRRIGFEEKRVASQERFNWWPSQTWFPRLVWVGSAAAIGLIIFLSVPNQKENNISVTKNNNTTVATRVVAGTQVKGGILTKEKSVEFKGKGTQFSSSLALKVNYPAEKKNVTGPLTNNGAMSTAASNEVAQIPASRTQPVGQNVGAGPKYASMAPGKTNPTKASGVLGNESTPIPSPTLLPANQVAVAHNVFNPNNGESVKIITQLAQSGNVRIAIYNRLGQLVKVLVDQNRDAGTYTDQWNGLNDGSSVVANGIYIIHVIANNINQTQKVIVIK